MARLSLLENALLTIEDNLLVYALSHWTPREILNSAVLSSSMHGIVQHYKELVWNADAHFGAWFGDTPRFRSVLQACGAIVSGSQILQFLDRSNYLDSDMDIFLRVGGVTLMGDFLHKQGYSLDGVSADYSADSLGDQVLALTSTLMNQDAAPTPPIRGVCNYRRFIASPTTIYAQKVQLVCVDMDPIHHILFDFHSTAVMNYMTADRVVSLFPRSTFILRKTYLSKIAPESPTRVCWRIKYQDRGFRVVQKRSHGNHPDLTLGPRTSSDGQCWIMKLAGEYQLHPSRYDTDRDSAPPLMDRIYRPTTDGVRFDVMHWRSGVTQDDCYIRIADPGIWRCLAKIRRKYPGLLNREASE